MRERRDPLDPDPDYVAPDAGEPRGPGGSPAPTWQIVVLGGVLMGAIMLVFYLLLQLWPHPTPSTAPPDVTAGSPRPPATDTGTARGPGTTRQPLDVTAAADTAAAAARTATRAPRDTGAAAGSPGAAETSCRSRVRAEWAGSTTPAPAGCVRLFGREVLLWDEQRLLALVMLGGALGSLLFALRSLGWYVGNRKLVRSWILRYLVLAFTGSALAFIFYVVVRGGFFSPGTSIESTSPFGFIAFATLVGLFSEQAILKLKEVAETLLSKPAPGRDAAPQRSGSGTPAVPPGATPKIASIAREVDATGSQTDTFRITGTGFVPLSEVLVGGVPQKSTYVSATELRFALAPAAVAGTTLRVQVRNPGNHTDEMSATA